MFLSSHGRSHLPAILTDMKYFLSSKKEARLDELNFTVLIYIAPQVDKLECGCHHSELMRSTRAFKTAVLVQPSSVAVEYVLFKSKKKHLPLRTTEKLHSFLN